MFRCVRQRAFSLLEVCVVLALVSLMLPLLLQSYAGSLRYFERMRHYSRDVQERIWLRQFFIEQSQLAGMTACGGVGLLEGFDDKAFAPVRLEKNTLWFGHASAYQLLDSIPKGNTLPLKKSPGLRSGDKLMLSDCQHVEMKRVAGREAHTLFLQDALKTVFQAPVFLAPWEEYGLVFESVSEQKSKQLYLKHGRHKEPLFPVRRFKLKLDSPHGKTSILVSVRWASGVRLHERFYIQHS